MNIQAKLLTEIQSGGVEWDTVYRFLNSFGLARMAIFNKLPNGKEELILCGVYKYLYTPKTQSLTSYRRSLNIVDGNLTYDWIKTGSKLPVRMVYIPGSSMSEEYKCWINKIALWMMQDLNKLGIKGVSAYEWNWETDWGLYKEKQNADKDSVEAYYMGCCETFIKSKSSHLLNYDWVDSRIIAHSDTLGLNLYNRLTAFISKDSITYGHKYCMKHTRTWLDRRYVSLYLRGLLSGQRKIMSEIYFSTILELKANKIDVEKLLAHDAHLPYISLINKSHYSRPDLLSNRVMLECLEESGHKVSKGDLRLLLKQKKKLSKFMVEQVYKGTRTDYVGVRHQEFTLHRFAKILRLKGFDALPETIKIKVLEQFDRGYGHDVVEKWLACYHRDFKRHGPASQEGFYQNIFNELRHVFDWIDRATPTPQIHKNQDWASVHQASVEWTRRLIQQRKHDREHFVWKSALPTFEHNGITVRELVTGHELDIEGAEMMHCVSSYDEDCQMGNYRVFSLKSDNEHERTTFGVYIDAHGAEFDQLQTFDNCATSYPSKDMREAANVVIEKLNKLAIEEGIAA